MVQWKRRIGNTSLHPPQPVEFFPLPSSIAAKVGGLQHELQYEEIA